MEIVRDFGETAELDSIVVLLVVRDALQVTCQAFGTVVLEAHVMRGSRSFGYNAHPVRIVFPDCFCAPRPATEGKLEIRILVFLPGRETTGFSKSFGRKQSKREWDCNASMRFKLERDIRQLLAVGRSEAVSADVDSAKSLADIRALVRDRGKQQQRGKRIGRQFRDADVLIRDLFFRREATFDGRELHVVDEDLAAVDLQLQRFVFAVANQLTELLELHERRREVVCQVGKQSEFDLLNHIAGSEVKHVRFSFDFDPLIRLDQRCPRDQFSQSRQGSGQRVFVYRDFHKFLHSFG